MSSTMSKTTKFSCELSECMDLSGYSIKMIKYRQKTNAQLDSIYNDTIQPVVKFSVLTTGGKGEGTAKYFESDIDRLNTHTEIVCTTTDQISPSDVNGGSPMTIVRSNSEGCAHGYTRLELVKFGDGRSGYYVRKSLLEVDGTVYIKNDFPKIDDHGLLYDVNGMPIYGFSKSGPSQSAGSLDISYDFAHGFTYDSNHFLGKWSTRARYYDWPSSELIRDVLHTKGHVVPVASKITDFLDTEWRICYTEAELLLIRSLNEYQIKVYILMKLTSKTVLQQISKEISSYVNKNVIFWMSEQHPLSYFKKESLFDVFCEALRFLRDCLEDGELRNYIIPERNLLEGRSSTSQREQLVDAINKLLSANINMLDDLKIGKTLQHLRSSPKDLKTISKIRDIAEELLLKRNEAFKIVEGKCYAGDIDDKFPEMLAADKDFHDIGERLNDLVLPEWRDLQTTGVNTIDIFKSKLTELLS